MGYDLDKAPFKLMQIIKAYTVSIQKWATVVPPAKRHSNGVLLMGRDCSRFMLVEYLMKSDFLVVHRLLD